MRKTTQIKMDRIRELYRNGNDRDKIVAIMSKTGDMSVASYYRLVKMMGGFTADDNVAHHQAKLREVTNG